MTKYTIWATSDDGSIDYISVCPEYLDGALDVIGKAFIPYEAACRAIADISQQSDFKELEELTLNTIRDGVSIIAVDKSSKQVVGGAINKIQVNNNEADGTYFESFSKSCKSPTSKALVQFMIDADASYDIFKHCGINCLLEIMFLAVLPQYRGKNIATRLCEVSIEAARKLFNGENIKKSIDGRELSLEPVPKAVTAIFTGQQSQRVGRKINFEIATTISYDNFYHNGKKFSDVLGKDSFTTLEYIQF